MLLAIFEQRDWTTQTAVEIAASRMAYVERVFVGYGKKYSLLTGALSAL
jgi:hypothetical protein